MLQWLALYIKNCYIKKMRMECQTFRRTERYSSLAVGLLYQLFRTLSHFFGSYRMSSSLFLFCLISLSLSKMKFCRQHGHGYVSSSFSWYNLPSNLDGTRRDDIYPCWKTTQWYLLRDIDPSSIQQRISPIQVVRCYCCRQNKTMVCCALAKMMLTMMKAW